MAIRNRKQVDAIPVATEAVVTTKITAPTKSSHVYFHQLLPWQQDNHYIRLGYLPQLNLFTGCFNLLFHIHNETGNIYSHLIPGLLAFLAVAAYLKWGIVRYANDQGWWENANFLLFGAACWGCLSMSLVFHCLKAHSQKVQRFGNQLDYFGIVILITCLLILIVNFAYVDETAKYVFDAIFLIFGGMCTVLTLHPQFATPTYRPFRLFMFILFGLSGVLPVVMGVRWYGALVAWERSLIKWLVLEGVSYISGALLYAGRIPERFTHIDETEEMLETSPKRGRFDIWGHSHQIFHVMVVVGAFCHWKALVGCYEYMHKYLLD